MPNNDLNKRRARAANRCLTDLTPGEQLWLARLQRGCTQTEMSKVLGVGRKLYGRLELDRESLPTEARKPAHRRPSAGQLCALARRRDGRGLRRLAALLVAGSHVTLLTMERRSDPRLVAAWVRKGYQF